MSLQTDVPEKSWIEIGGRRVGVGYPTYIVAEMSANHGHDLDHAIEILRAAKAARADAIKLQTYTPDTMTLNRAEDVFRIPSGTTWGDRTLYDLYREAFTPWEWHERLQAEAHAMGLGFFSTPFDDSAVAFLERLEPPAYKIASFELVDLELIRCVAATGRPLILSTGMATLEEVTEAVVAAREAGCRQLALLKCTSAYPAPVSEMNLAAIPYLSRQFGVPVGLSDHTLSDEAAIAAVALGASIVEKHLTLSRAEPGPDSSFSLEPAEFARLVCAIRNVEAALGRPELEMTASETDNRMFRRSLFVTAAIRAGEPLTRDNVRSVRPGVGLPPRHLDAVLGRRAARNIAPGTPLTWKLIQQEPGEERS